MNTNVKVGIAAAIVAALVALIVLDQKTTPRDDAAVHSPSGDAATITQNGAPSAEPAAQRQREEEVNSIIQRATKQFAPPAEKAPASGTGIKGSEERNEKKIPSPTGEEYVIKEGDSYETIAQKLYGSKSYAAMLAEANPTVKATSLRVGKKLVVPPRPDKKDEAPLAKPADAAPTTETPADPAPKKVDALATGSDGKKVYTVQPGDTLSGISVKVYNTSRHYQKIYDANKESIDDPNTLMVGAKLNMPDLPSKPVAANTGAPGTGAAPTTLTPPLALPAGAKVCQVSQGDRLWSIAEKFAAEKKIGIMEMIKQIVAANPEKLKDASTMLQVGWQLIIPQ